ncbi:class I adenylate-forming enzyme family protein [Paenibacillus massiliensis]|uniref:class I adenylate-forming enzyme family protein n=1 Tax=Paenibacillus massiliensis TaxID=225917 RepID=UPI00037D8DB6|nr:fatty acid--CoA ligase family protein [Paenibacillus massiliensis]
MGRIAKLLRDCLPHRTVITDGDRSVTYGELLAFLKEATFPSMLEAGERNCPNVGLVMDQSLESILLLLKLLEDQRSVLLVDAMQTPEEVERVAETSGMSRWVVPALWVSSFHESLKASAMDCGQIWTYSSGEKLDHQHEGRHKLDHDHNHNHNQELVFLQPYRSIPLEACTDSSFSARSCAINDRGELSGAVVEAAGSLHESERLYLLSSGTTGFPKVACLNLKTVIQEGEKYNSWFGYDQVDTIVATVPLNHLYGLSGGLFAALIGGITLSVCRQPTPRRAAAQLQNGGRTILLGVPSFYRLLIAAQQLDRQALASLQFGISAGGPLSAAEAEQFESKFGQRVLRLYGSTETGAVAAEHLLTRGRPQACGMLLPGVKARVSAEGRLEVCGEGIFAGYIEHGAKLVPPVMMDDYYLTEDYASVIGQELVITGRRSKHINVAGRKINPLEIEHALQQMEGVVSVKVTGAPDKLQGEIIRAWLVTSAMLTQADVRKYLKGKVAPYKVPHDIRITDRLPGWKTAYASEDVNETGREEESRHEPGNARQGGNQA